MSKKRHGDNLIQIGRWGSIINCYLVRESDGFTLIDTGMGGSADTILEAARSNGGEIRRIILTHAHMDHVGSLDALVEKLPDAEFIAGEREARFLAGDKALLPDEPKDKPRGGYVQPKAQPTRTVNDSDMIESLQVIASPGHTPGHIALYDTRDGSLIAGDAMQTQGGVAVIGMFKLFFPLPFFATWHKPTALRSAKRLHELNPSRLAVGHGKVLESPGAKMAQAIAEAEKAWG